MRPPVALAAWWLVAVGGASATPSPVRVQASFLSALVYDATSRPTEYCRAGVEIFTGIARSSSAAYCVDWESDMDLTPSPTPVAPDMMSLAWATFSMSPDAVSTLQSNATTSAFSVRLRELGFFTLPAGSVTMLSVADGVADKIAATATMGLIVVLVAIVTLCMVLSTRYSPCGCGEMSCDRL